MNGRMREALRGVRSVTRGRWESHLVSRHVLISSSSAQWGTSSKARCKEGYEAMENEVLNTETHNKYQATSNKYTPARANSHPIRRFTYLKYVIKSHDLHAQQTQKTHGWNFPRQESTFPGSKWVAQSHPHPQSNTRTQVTQAGWLPSAAHLSPLSIIYFLCILKKSASAFGVPCRAPCWTIM